MYVEGLVDAKDESTFEATLSVLENKWKKADPSVSQFVRWFRTYKLSVFVQSMLRPIRESARLGTPPDEFTTNPSESANAVLKTKVNYKRSELPEFVQSILELVREQQHELERTAIRRGKYRFQDAYSHLEVAERKWFGMTTEQREGHMKKVAHTKVAVIMPCVQGDRERTLSLLLWLLAVIVVHQLQLVQLEEESFLLMQLVLAKAYLFLTQP